MVYSKSYCPFCVATKDLLRGKNIAFEVVELDQVPDGAQIQAALAQKSGQRTVPNVWINGEHIGGNSDLQALNQSGQLEAKVDDLQSSRPNNFAS